MNYRAVRCPVCEGSGTYTDYRDFGQTSNAAPATRVRVCHGCDGRGWVEVKASASEADPAQAPALDAAQTMAGGEMMTHKAEARM